jgi:hypothetical protein
MVRLNPKSQTPPDIKHPLFTVPKYVPAQSAESDSMLQAFCCRCLPWNACPPEAMLALDVIYDQTLNEKDIMSWAIQIKIQ